MSSLRVAAHRVVFDRAAGQPAVVARKSASVHRQRALVLVVDSPAPGIARPVFAGVPRKGAIADGHGPRIVVDGAAVVGRIVASRNVVAQRQKPRVRNGAAVRVRTAVGMVVGKRRVADGQRARVDDRAAAVGGVVRAVLQVQVREHDICAAIDLEQERIAAGVNGQRNAGTAAVEGDRAGAGDLGAELQLTFLEVDGPVPQAGVERNRVGNALRRVAVGLAHGVPQGNLPRHLVIGGVVDHDRREHESIFESFEAAWSCRDEPRTKGRPVAGRDAPLFLPCEKNDRGNMGDSSSCQLPLGTAFPPLPRKKRHFVIRPLSGVLLTRTSRKIGSLGIFYQADLSKSILQEFRVAEKIRGGSVSR